MDVIDKLVSIEEQIAGLHAQQLRLIASLRDPIADVKGSRHDDLKHEAAGWQLKLLPDAVEWTDPAGRTYHVEPHTRPLDTTTRSTISSTDNPSPAAAWADDDGTGDSDQLRRSNEASS